MQETILIVKILYTNLNLSTFIPSVCQNSAKTFFSDIHTFFISICKFLVAQVVLLIFSLRLGQVSCRPCLPQIPIRNNKEYANGTKLPRVHEGTFPSPNLVISLPIIFALLICRTLDPSGWNMSIWGSFGTTGNKKLFNKFL